MPIDKTFLEVHGESQLVVMSPNQTLQEAIAKLKQLAYSENQAYLVVQLNAKEAMVASFAELVPQVIQPLGYDSFTTSLRELPLRLADKVVRSDIAQSGLKVLDWVAARPQARLVVVDDGGVVGVLTNANRSGGHFDGLSLLGLHGELNNSTEKLNTFTRLVPYPVCPNPNCKHEGFAQFKGGKYSCAKCNHEQDKPW